MATPDPTDCATEDRRTEHAVLSYLLELHPVQLTMPEVVLAFGGNPGDFTGVDAIERAVRDLTRAGLLRRCETLVLPSYAALYFGRLMEEA